MLYSRTIGTGKDLVLLHGWGFSGAIFDDIISRYKNQYRLSIIDLPGHGKSSEIDGGLAQWVDEIIKILPQNPILLGWSLGGLLAIDIATKIPLSRLILVATTPKFVQTECWKFGIDADNFRQFSTTLKLDLTQGLKRFASLQVQNKTQLKKLNLTIEQYPASTKALNQGLEILLTTDLRVQLRALNLPILVILGDKDTLVPATITQWYGQNKINVRLLSSGHLPFLHPDFSL
jgi:pimeloyl-[acyl-carrier protein] methyl ester esterase